jgi:hypothetical protein
VCARPLWSVDANLNYLPSQSYGPYSGWTAESLSVDTSTINRFRVLWMDTDGRVSIWIVDSSLNLVSSKVYGPYFGFDPTPGAALPSFRPACGVLSELAGTQTRR